MKDEEIAVVEAAREWVNHPSESRGRALQEAVRKLDANTCPVQGLVGDASWPMTVSCERTRGHVDEYHKDPLSGLEWRSRR